MTNRQPRRPSRPRFSAWPSCYVPSHSGPGKKKDRHNERDEWELPGGKLELGEDPPTCLAREISEETGWSVAVRSILDSWRYHIRDGVDVLIVTYGCQVDTDAAPEVSHEHKEAGLFIASEASALRMPEGYKRSIAAWYAQLNR